MEAWKAWLVFCAVLFALLGAGLILPIYLIGTGLEDFGNPGNRERRMAANALFHGTGLYGDGLLEIGDYNGPPLVLGWYVEGVEECPPLPGGRKPEADSYRAFGGRGPASARTPSLGSPGARWSSPAGAAGSGSRTSENPLKPKFGDQPFYEVG
jgi:hypothetical protein